MARPRRRGREDLIKIVILTSSTTGNIYLVNQLLRRHQIVGMVIEAPPPALTQEEKRNRRQRMVERHGLLRAMNKLAFNAVRWRFISPKDQLIQREQFFPAGAQVAYERTVPSITVPNINDPRCVEFIRGLAPDLIAVCGTGVIKREVFSLAPRGAINIHTGITPEYRSADPIFWAIYNNQADKVGVTIHFVDDGIDTGAIIHQQRVPCYANDSLASIYARCVRMGSQLYLQALDDIAGDRVRKIDRSHVAGKAYYSINLGIVQYLVFLWRFGRFKRGLPAAETLSMTTEAN